jgi:hypothetical protein
VVKTNSYIGVICFESNALQSCPMMDQISSEQKTAAGPQFAMDGGRHFFRFAQ